ncbi:protein-disulfide reductase DsbD [Leucothrix arctica]|uniref:Thiol:disulfide interchange protein DsbD n=1 Tax=Leucothrix arctica TaxID=1481894 RepID=A0A317CRS7_9GAMM|nr:protein-disulfide reductase DsbD [Leucothrix arctica]PWQ99012.1 thiol:disulfide interchange protein [Leucothrix arctica]
MIKALFSALIITITCAVTASAQDSLLRPSEAFKLSTEVINANTIRATWTIEDGYYLYKDKIDFISETDDSTIGIFSKPAGKTKQDPTFGEVQIYRDTVAFDLPLTHAAITPSTLTLLSKSQGCADIGLCYPPQKRTVTVDLPEVDTQQIEKSITSSVSKRPISLAQQLGLGSTGGISSISGSTALENDSSQPLHPDEAFALDVIATDSNTINARWNVTPGHYIYQHKVAFKIINTDADIKLGKPSLPEGKAFNDVYFGDVVTYEKDFDVVVPVRGYQEILDIEVKYQGCSKLTGICYPEQTKTQTVDFSSFEPSDKDLISPEDTADTSTDESLTSVKTSLISEVTPSGPVSEQSVLGDILKNQSIWTVVGAFFLGGLLLTFTPCVFPMIPILSGIITGQGESLTRGRSFALSLAYVIPMALTYAVAGVIAGYTGANLTATLQNPWVISVFAMLFVVLSFSMFGFYELQMPSAIQNRLNNLSNTQRSGSLFGAGIMGILSALIVGPCVTAPLIAALAYIADTKDVVLGGLSLFMLGMGMGAPLLVIGFSAGSILPRAGAWMETVKHVFGVMMLALAIWMLDRVIAPQFTLLLSGMLLIGSAIYLGATDTLNEQSTGWKRLWKSSGVVALLFGVILIVGAAAGSKSYFSPLSGLLSTGQGASSTNESQATEGLKFQRITSLVDLNSQIEKAKSNNKAVMLDFYAYWCLPCREMEHSVFSDMSIVTSLEDTVLLQADVTDMTAEDGELLKSLNVFGPPHVVFYDKNGEEMKDYRISGEMKLQPFKQHIQQFLSSL